MGDESIPVYVFRLGESAGTEEFEELKEVFRSAVSRSDVDAEFVLLNEGVEPIGKDELEGMICDE